MADFFFYRYKFIRVNPDLRFGEKPSKDEPEKILSRILQGERLPLIQKSKKGDVVATYDDYLYNHDGVALMRVQKSKEVPIYRRDFSKDKDESFPFLDIAFDNREGQHLIAIEKNGIFNKRKHDANSTQRVAELVAATISEEMQRDGWNIVIEPIAKRQGLWATMISHVRDGNARVKSIEFKFPSADEDNGDDTQTNNTIRMLMQLSRKNGAEDADFRMNYKNGDEAELRKVHEDFKAMEIFASNQHYELNVTFNDMSVARSGSKLYAHLEILDRDIANFITGAPGFGKDGKGEFMLCNYLIETNDTLKNYEREGAVG